MQICSNWTEMIWSDLKSFLRFLESVLMETAVKILCSIAEADKVAYKCILNRWVSFIGGFIKIKFFHFVAFDTCESTNVFLISD
jgi:hypothetical protein